MVLRSGWVLCPACGVCFLRAVPISLNVGSRFYCWCPDCRTFSKFLFYKEL